MPTQTLELAKRFLYFNYPTAEEFKDILYNLFCDTWDKIPSEDLKKIEDTLDFIIMKQIIDPLHPSTGGTTLFSPSMLSWIMLDPFILSLHTESKRFILAHELAHVFLQHPQTGSRMSREDEKKWSSDTAEHEACYQTLKVWQFKPSFEDKEYFKNVDY